jgi:predicted small integral membrane protein
MRSVIRHAGSLTISLSHLCEGAEQLICMSGRRGLIPFRLKRSVMNVLSLIGVQFRRLAWVVLVNRKGKGGQRDGSKIVHAILKTGSLRGDVVVFGRRRRMFY